MAAAHYRNPQDIGTRSHFCNAKNDYFILGISTAESPYENVNVR